MFKGLFDPENSFWEFMTNITNVLFVGLIWLGCCTPIITIGASTTALYDYILKIAEDKDGYLVKSFFTSFKNNFLKSTLLWLLMVAFAGFLMIDAYICLQMGNSLGNFLFFIILSIGIAYLIMCLYIFPVLAYFQKSIKETIKTSFVISVGNLPLTIIIIIILVFAAYLTYSAPYLVLLLPSYAVYLTSFFYLSIFKKIV